jgi:nitrite reductase/ring-hydroxylating ferredoxin subunit
MHRAISAIVDRQEGWATPLGERVQHALGPVLRDHQPVKDALNGTWLGHPVHPAVTDVPVGALTVAALLDLAGQDRAADIAVATGVAGMAASAATGAADAVDTYGRPRILATVHATLMTGSLVAYGASLLLRVGPRAGRPLARLLALAGYGALTAGAYVGGDLTYKLGNQVDRHAFRAAGAKWKAIDVTEVPEGRLVKAMFGNEPLVLWRDGEAIRALHATCAHAGGPLDQGTPVDGCVECPWHQSRFRLADGHVVQGPAVHDQPVYEIRSTENGFEARRASRAR